MNIIKIDEITQEQVASICDHTFLNRPEAYRSEAKKQGVSAVRLYQQDLRGRLRGVLDLPYKPYSVCLRPEVVGLARVYLTENGLPYVKVASVVGFPNVQDYSTSFKVMETKQALAAGATEIDMVLDYDQLKRKNLAFLGNDIFSVVQAAHENDALVKLILEISELSDNEIAEACRLGVNYGVDFIKTSTGFSESGASEKALRIMKDNFGGGIKISGDVSQLNLKGLLRAASGRTDGYILLDPLGIRIGESSLLTTAKTIY